MKRHARTVNAGANRVPSAAPMKPELQSTTSSTDEAMSVRVLVAFAVVTAMPKVNHSARE